MNLGQFEGVHLKLLHSKFKEIWSKPGGDDHRYCYENSTKYFQIIGGCCPIIIIIIIIIIITIFIEEAFSLKSGLQKGPQKIKNLQY